MQFLEDGELTVIGYSCLYMTTVTSLSVFKMLAISQHYFHCMITYKPTAITTDRTDSGSSVERDLSYLSQHAVFSVTQSELPHSIKYD